LGKNLGYVVETFALFSAACDNLDFRSFFYAEHEQLQNGTAACFFAAFAYRNSGGAEPARFRNPERHPRVEPVFVVDRYFFCDHCRSPV
jgi:hypothetical protein